jgi:hypothetical protein
MAIELENRPMVLTALEFSRWDGYYIDTIHSLDYLF